MNRSPSLLLVLLFAALSGPCRAVPSASSSSTRTVQVPAGSNQMAMMAPPPVTRKSQVLGITVVSGNAWEPEEVAHTLRMLELIHRPDVPVVPGAVFPLLRTEAERPRSTQKPSTAPSPGTVPGAISPPTPALSPTTRPSSIPSSHRRQTPPSSPLPKTPLTSSSTRSTPTRTKSPSTPPARSPTSRSPSPSIPASPPSPRASS